MDFLSDPDIADTLLGDDSSPNLRGKKCVFNYFVQIK